MSHQPNTLQDKKTFSENRWGFAYLGLGGGYN